MVGQDSEFRKLQVTGGSTIIVSLPKEWVKSNDLKKGDVVSFMPDSEYEFRLDDRILYRIRSKNIIAYESKRD